MPLADYAHPPELSGRRETRLPDGSQIIFVPGSPLPWRSINSLGVKVGDYPSESLAQSALNDQIVATPETPKRARCSHCRSGYHTADDCPVKAAEGERIAAARKEKDMATTPRLPTDSDYLSAVRRMDAGFGVRAADADRAFDNIISTRAALDRLAAAGQLTRTVNGKKAARYRVASPNPPALVLPTGEWPLPDHLPGLPDPLPTPPEILDPDVLRPGGPTECGALINGDPPDIAIAKAISLHDDEIHGPMSEEELAEMRAAGPDGEDGDEDEEDAPYVCPGCHAVGEEPCAPGCIDAEIEAERRHDMEEENWDTESDDDEPEFTMAEIREHLPDGGYAFDHDDDDPDDPDPWDSWLPDVRQSAADVSTAPVALTPIKAQQIIRREQRLRFTRDERAAELREAVRVLRELVDVGEGLIAEVGR